MGPCGSPIELASRAGLSSNPNASKRTIEREPIPYDVGLPVIFASERVRDFSDTH